MATRSLCDGCGAILPNGTAPTEYGFIRITIYCESCEPSVLRFVAARDDLHTRLAQEWTKSVDDLRESWKQDHPNGRLPDE